MREGGRERERRKRKSNKGDGACIQVASLLQHESSAATHKAPLGPLQQLLIVVQLEDLVTLVLLDGGLVGLLE